jgi:hypothetical protein
VRGAVENPTREAAAPAANATRVGSRVRHVPDMVARTEAARKPVKAEQRVGLRGAFAVRFL